MAVEEQIPEKWSDDFRRVVCLVLRGGPSTQALDGLYIKVGPGKWATRKVGAGMGELVVDSPN